MMSKSLTKINTFSCLQAMAPGIRWSSFVTTGLHVTVLIKNIDFCPGIGTGFPGKQDDVIKHDGEFKTCTDYLHTQPPYSMQEFTWPA